MTSKQRCSYILYTNIFNSVQLKIKKKIHQNLLTSISYSTHIYIQLIQVIVVQQLKIRSQQRKNIYNIESFQFTSFLSFIVQSSVIMFQTDFFNDLAYSPKGIKTKEKKHMQYISVRIKIMR